MEDHQNNFIENKKRNKKSTFSSKLPQPLASNLIMQTEQAVVIELSDKSSGKIISLFIYLF